LAKLKATTEQGPWHRGDLECDELALEPKRFVPNSEGLLRLWVHPGPDGRPPRGTYVLGLDLALGLAGDSSSNSAIVGIDAISGSQVCEFITAAMDGTKMAEYATILARWFWNAQINFERNGGGGSAFAKRIWRDRIYDNLYYLKEDNGKRKKVPGVHYSAPAPKYTFLTALSGAMSTGDFLPRSGIFLKECSEFYFKDSIVVHRGEQDTQNDASKRDAHGDVVIGAAMAWMAAAEIQDVWRQKDERGGAEETTLSLEEAPLGSYARRMLERRHGEEKQGSWLAFR
jgi:hypothetical protein